MFRSQARVTLNASVVLSVLLKLRCVLLFWLFQAQPGDMRNTEKGEAQVAVGLTDISHHLCGWHWVDPKSSICFCCHVVISLQRFFDKYHCLPSLCPFRTQGFFIAFHRSDISFGSIPDSNWAALRRRLISIKSPFDLGLSGAATTAVQSLWYGGFKIGFKAALNSRRLVCAAQGCPAWYLLLFQLCVELLIGWSGKCADWWREGPSWEKQLDSIIITLLNNTKAERDTHMHTHVGL